MKYKFYILSIFLLLFSAKGISQNAGIQFNTGFGKPIVMFDAPNSTVNYQSAMNNDTRLGVFVGDYDKVSFALLFGMFNVNANYVNADGLSSEFQSSNLIIDLPFRYAFKDGFVKSMSLGPCMYVLMSSSQSINGKPVYNDRMFNPINWGLGAEIAIKGYEGESFCLSPYVNYKQMLTSADAANSNESLKMHSISFGLRCDIPLQ
jgi:hypothetical protein